MNWSVQGSRVYRVTTLEGHPVCWESDFITHFLVITVAARRAPILVATVKKIVGDFEIYRVSNKKQM